MIKQEITNDLVKHHEAFVDMLLRLRNDDFTLSANNKWNAAQQLDHIYKSVAPVALAFRLPKFLPAMLYGRANRPSRNYLRLVEKYRAKLAGGYKASIRYAPNNTPVIAREKLADKLLQTIGKLCRRLDRYSQMELDAYILPHPLLGKLTLREMMYFTIYHVQHHHKLSLDNLANAKVAASINGYAF
jgi:hypothetical protein